MIKNRLAWLVPFALKFFGLILVRHRSFVNICEAAQKIFVLAMHYLGYPSPMFSIPRHSALAACSFKDGPVPHVLLERSLAKISDPVIGRVAINVIDKLRGPFSFAHSPDNAGNKKSAPINANSLSSLAVLTYHRTCRDAILRWGSARQKPGFRVVSKHKVQFGW